MIGFIEELAFEAYPVSIGDTHNYDENLQRREAFIQGYKKCLSFHIEKMNLIEELILKLPGDDRH